jgi:hypothetical protein
VLPDILAVLVLIPTQTSSCFRSSFRAIAARVVRYVRSFPLSQKEPARLLARRTTESGQAFPLLWRDLPCNRQVLAHCRRHLPGRL